MRCFNNGCFFTVTVMALDVNDFANRWPCSGLRARSVTFQFDKRNGDLVDSDDARSQPNADGSAILALSQEAQSYGVRRLQLALPNPTPY